MSGMFFRVDHVVGYVHMEIGGVFMDATMPLMLGITQRGGKAFFNGHEHLRRQFCLVLQAKADHKMVGFVFRGADVYGLNVHGLGNAVLVIIIPKASGAPAHETFFAFMPGIGNVLGKTGVVVILGADIHFFADHRMPAMAC